MYVMQRRRMAPPRERDETHTYVLFRRRDSLPCLLQEEGFSVVYLYMHNAVLDSFTVCLPIDDVYVISSVSTYYIYPVVKNSVEYRVVVNGILASVIVMT